MASASNNDNLKPVGLQGKGLSNFWGNLSLARKLLAAFGTLAGGQAMELASLNLERR